MYICEQGLCQVKVTKPAFTYALISPDGTFYRTGDATHYHVAKWHIGRELDVLIDDGWLHLSTYANKPLSVSIDYLGRMQSTQAQREVLFDIVTIVGRESAAGRSLMTFIEGSES